MLYFKSFTVVLLTLFTYISTAQETTVYNSLSVPKELKTKANAVVRLSDISISIASKKSLKIIEKRIVTVLNEKGNSAIQAYSGYDKYNKIKKIEANIFDESGKEIKTIRKKDFIDRSAVDGGTLYSDSRVLFLGYTPTSYPYTVEFLCEIETSNTAAIPTWRPINDYYIGIEKATYKFTDNANLGMRFKEKNLEGFNLSTENTTNSLSYSMINTPSITPEDLSPSLSEFSPRVMVAVEHFSFYGVEGKAKNWVEFGDWINNSLLKGRDKITEETKQKIINITTGIDDNIEKAKKIFEYVQDNTRYISVQVGIGGVQPISALEVDELKYGDCKGLTNYTKSLLDVVEVPSYYTIVQAGRQIENLENDFASLEQGNHIILAIPNNEEMLWVDCTSQSHPFNFIGDFTDNRNVLVVKPKSSEILKTVSYADALNYQLTQAKINLGRDGSIVSTINIKTKGIQYDSRFFIETQSNKDIKLYYKEYWDNVNNLEVITYDFANNKTQVEFTETIEVSATNYATFIGDKMIFIPNAFNKNQFVPNRYRNRKLPIQIQRGYLDEDNFNFTVPEGYAVEAIPDSISIKTKFGDYQFSIEVVENQIIYTRRLLVKKGTYDSSEYDNYRNFRRKISKNDNSKIVLKAIN